MTHIDALILFGMEPCSTVGRERKRALNCIRILERGRGYSATGKVA